jgi:hypothetical protein
MLYWRFDFLLIFFLATVLHALLMHAVPSNAEPASTEAIRAPHFEAYTGFETVRGNASLYTLLIWSPYKAVTEPGLRLRIGGYGSVHGEGRQVWQSRFTGGKTGGDIMAGYQAAFGPLWLKLYAGAAFEETASITGTETGKGQRTGAKATAESWLKLTNSWSAAADASWSGADEGLSFGLRLERRLGTLPLAGAVSGGLEGSAYAKGDDSVLKSGAHIKFGDGLSELTLSGGLAQTGQDNDTSPYAGLSYGRKF